MFAVEPSPSYEGGVEQTLAVVAAAQALVKLANGLNGIQANLYLVLTMFSGFSVDSLHLVPGKKLKKLWKRKDQMGLDLYRASPHL